MASVSCHAKAVTKQVRLERIVRLHLRALDRLVADLADLVAFYALLHRAY